MVVRIISATYLTNQEPSRIFLSVRSSLFSQKSKNHPRNSLFLSQHALCPHKVISRLFCQNVKTNTNTFSYLRAYSLSLSFSNYALTHNYKPINKSNYVKFMVRFLFLCSHTNNRSYLYFSSPNPNSVNLKS